MDYSDKLRKKALDRLYTIFSCAAEDDGNLDEGEAHEGVGLTCAIRDSLGSHDLSKLEQALIRFGLD